LELSVAFHLVVSNKLIRFYFIILYNLIDFSRVILLLECVHHHQIALFKMTFASSTLHLLLRLVVLTSKVKRYEVIIIHKRLLVLVKSAECPLLHHVLTLIYVLLPISRPISICLIWVLLVSHFKI
jgi:hypothetical protein